MKISLGLCAKTYTFYFGIKYFQMGKFIGLNAQWTGCSDPKVHKCVEWIFRTNHVQILNQSWIFTMLIFTSLMLSFFQKLKLTVPFLNHMFYFTFLISSTSILCSVSQSWIRQNMMFAVVMNPFIFLCETFNSNF